MSHPRYADGDPKAGQPVLVGDVVYWTHGGEEGVWFKQTVRTVTAYTIAFENEWLLTWKNVAVFSQPPSPKIEPCACGRYLGAGVMWGADDKPQIRCNCGRSGQIMGARELAAAAWNSDMRALKSQVKTADGVAVRDGDTVYRTLKRCDGEWSNPQATTLSLCYETGDCEDHYAPVDESCYSSLEAARRVQKGQP